jgi:HAD superfamily hydrolase (TIGR01509 family)
MDGTLVSSLSCIYYCVNEISAKYIEKNLTLEAIIASFGPPARTIIRSITSNLAKDLQEKAVSDYYQCYRNNVATKVLVFPGIRGLLGKIRRSGRNLALLTGVEKVMMDYTLDAFDMSRYFHLLVSSDDVEKSKPDPEGVRLIFEKLKTNPKETMFVGDSPADMTAGKGAGVLTGAALWSPENRGDPTTEHPDFEFRSVEQLSAFLFPKKQTSEKEFYMAPKWTGQ